MSGRGYGVWCTQCRDFKPRNFFGGRGGTHKLCAICRQANTRAAAYKRIPDKAKQLAKAEKQKEINIKKLAKEFTRVTYQNRRLLRKLHSNLKPTEATIKAIERRTAAQEQWQTALDTLTQRIEKGENIHSLQQYFEGEP